MRMLLATPACPLGTPSEPLQADTAGALHPRRSNRARYPAETLVPEAGSTARPGGLPLPSRHPFQRLVARLVVAATGLGVVAGAAAASAPASYADLSLEELANVVITSVSRRPQALAVAAASIYVITSEDLRRSGATTLPEALRLAPTLHVAALNGHDYAISARGFNSRLSNKLLVMIDGRTVYSPLFSGVFWDAQDVLLDDVAQIEVISGPGGVTWGTNAVNGVINILTKRAGETQGATASAALGSRERGVSARYGLALGDSSHVRVYAKSFSRDSFEMRSGGSADDGFARTQAGFRTDWTSGHDFYTVQGDTYRGHSDIRPVAGAISVNGANLLGRWTRRFGAMADLDVQAYYDLAERRDNLLLQERAELFDVEAKGRLVTGPHRWLFGGGYRRGDDRSDPGLYIAFLPPKRSQTWYSAFVQDEIRLAEPLQLTLGARFEHNPYTGWETLPSVRLGWNLTPQDLLWTRLARTVRSPARLDRELYFPARPPYTIAGGAAFRSEVARTFEVGYRGQPSTAVSWSVAGFVTAYSHLRSAQVEASGITTIANRIEGQVRGLETTAQWQVQRDWKLRGGLVLLNKNLALAPGGNDPAGPNSGSNDPRAQWTLRSIHQLGERVQFDAAVRRVGALPKPEVPGYTAVDLRLAWRPRNDLEVAFTARNALDSGHVEFRSDPFTTQIARSAFVGLQWRFP